MTGVEHQVLELVAFVNKQVVDAHLPEVDKVIGSAVNLAGNLNEFCLQIGLAFL